MKKLKIKIPPELWTKNIQSILERTLHEYNTEPPYLTSFLCDPQLSEEELEIALKLLEAENAEMTKQKLIKAELETRRKPIVEEVFPADLRQEWINMQRAAEKTKKRNRNKKIRQKVLKDFMKGVGRSTKNI